MKPYPPFLHTFILAIMALTLLVSPLLAQKRSTSKKVRPMLTISHPVSKIKVVFDQPAFINKPFHDSAWRRVTIHLPDKTTQIIKLDDEMDGYMLESDEKELWSPDGKFLAVWLVYGILNKDQFSGMRIVFIKLEDGMEIGFRSKDDDSVTTDNFGGWYPNKPHVIKKGANTPSGHQEAFIYGGH